MSHGERRSALNPSGPPMHCRVFEICFSEMTAVEGGSPQLGGDAILLSVSSTRMRRHEDMCVSPAVKARISRVDENFF